MDALTWLNNTSSMVDVCNRTPELHDYGFYRKLNNGKVEFISFCNPDAYNMLSMTPGDYENLLKGLVPSKP